MKLFQYCMQNLGLLSLFKVWTVPLIRMLLGVQVMKPTFAGDCIFTSCYPINKRDLKRVKTQDLIYIHGLDQFNIGSDVT